MQLLAYIQWGQVGQTWQNWGFLPGLMDNSIPFRANNSVFSSLWISFHYLSFCFSDILHLSTYNFTYAYLLGLQAHVLFQPHFIFIPIPCCLQLPVGTTAPTVTPNLFWYTQLPVSTTFKNPHVPMLVYAATGICAAPHQTMSGNQ